MNRLEPAELYGRMLRIRRVEEAIADAYPNREMRCPVHLSIGQEAVAVGTCSALEASDHIYSNHRCHAHYLAKGGDLRAMVAELFGKETGCARGKGGSMHLVDVSVGMMGASALVAGTIPMAVGSALAFSRAGGKNVAVCYFGDGATEEGVLYESLNFAALHRLPVVFVCENNGYATFSPISARQATSSSADRAAAFGVASRRIDGNDVCNVQQEMSQAVAQARAGAGPTYLECVTYRWRDHVGPGWGVDNGYRTPGEVEAWKLRCPLLRLEESIEASVRAEWESIVRREIDEAFDFARRSPEPRAAALLEDVYAQP